MTEKISQFGYSVRKSKLVNTVSASFNTVRGQMADMLQWKKTGGNSLICYLKNTIKPQKYTYKNL